MKILRFTQIAKVILPSFLLFFVVGFSGEVFGDPAATPQLEGEPVVIGSVMYSGPHNTGKMHGR